MLVIGAKFPLLDAWCNLVITFNDLRNFFAAQYIPLTQYNGVVQDIIGAKSDSTDTASVGAVIAVGFTAWLRHEGLRRDIDNVARLALIRRLWPYLARHGHSIERALLAPKEVQMPQFSIGLLESQYVTWPGIGDGYFDLGRSEMRAGMIGWVPVWTTVVDVNRLYFQTIQRVEKWRGKDAPNPVPAVGTDPAPANG